MTKDSRKSIPADTMAAVLVNSRRRCCLCFGLDGDKAQKPGQIAHVNKNRADNREENLAWLSLEHHDSYDGRTSQSKGLTAGEVRSYRAGLHRFVEEELAIAPTSQVGKDESRPDLANVLAQSGDFFEPVKSAVANQHQITHGLKDFRSLMSEISTKMKQQTADSKALLKSPSRSRISAHWNSSGFYYSTKAQLVRDQTARLSQKTKEMIALMEKAHVLGTDQPGLSKEHYQQRIQQLEEHLGVLDSTQGSGQALVDVIISWPRTESRVFNRGRRELASGIAAFVEDMGRQRQALREQILIISELLRLV